MPTLTVCPLCQRRVRPVPIVFGYPMPETMEAAERGEVILGGCLVDGNEPSARCPKCGIDLVRDDGFYRIHVR
jgi:uncharacterized Zn finger protein (UPF0148 family)